MQNYPEQSAGELHRPHPTRKRWISPLRLVIWIGIGACLWILALLLIPRANYFLTYGDSVLSWAAGRLLINHQNPYDENLVIQKMKEAGREVDPDGSTPKPQMVYPPWVFIILIPFGFLPYPLFRLAWLIGQIIAILITADMVWIHYFKSNEKRIWSWVLCLTFAPTVRAISIGNLVTFLVLVLAALVITNDKLNYSWKRDLLIGGLAAFLTVKPQLLFLYLFAIILWSFNHRKFFIFSGFGLALILCTLLAVIFNDKIIQFYIAAILSLPVSAWVTPTIGSLLRMIFGPEKIWLQLLPSLAGLVWLLMYRIRHKNNWKWQNASPLIIMVSLLTAAYAWTYDLVFLIIPLIFAFEKLSKIQDRKTFWRITISYCALNNLVFVFYSRTNDFYLFWLPAILAIFYLLIEKITKQSSLIKNPAF